jgi:hypothetical protein
MKTNGVATILLEANLSLGKSLFFILRNVVVDTDDNDDDDDEEEEEDGRVYNMC